jgi:hypothetical protein
MRRNIRFLVVLVWAALAPASAQATLHSVSSSVQTNFRGQLVQHLRYADGSGKVRYSGIYTGITSQYQPFIYLQRKVYSKDYYGYVWENVNGVTGNLNPFNQAQFELKGLWNSKVRRQIERLKAKGPVRILADIETFDVYTQRWALVGNITLSL